MIILIQFLYLSQQLLKANHRFLQLQSNMKSIFLVFQQIEKNIIKPSNSTRAIWQFRAYCIIHSLAVWGYAMKEIYISISGILLFHSIPPFGYEFQLAPRNWLAVARLLPHHQSLSPQILKIYLYKEWKEAAGSAVCTLKR